MNQTAPAILLTLLAVALPFASAQGGIWNGDPNLLDPDSFAPIRWEEVVDPNGLTPIGWEEMLELLLARDREVMPWLRAASLPSPDNAALLYYQAFLLRPDRDNTTYESFDKVLRGGEPDSKVRLYLRLCRDTIRLAEMAGQIPQCTWGLSHPDGRNAPTPMLAEARQLTFVLSVDARTLAFDGYGQASLARCLTIRQLARHVGDDTLLTLHVSRGVDAFAHKTIQGVLGLLPPDAAALQWLRGQLVMIEPTPRSLAKVLQTDFELFLHVFANDPAYLQVIKEALAQEGDGGGADGSPILTDEEVLARARQPYAAFLGDVFRVLDADMIYEQKYRALEDLTAEFVDQYGDDPAAGAVILWNVGQIADTYALLVHALAWHSALKAAVEVYHVVATTGELPESLPANVPQDPFSGQDFEYEITDDGFTLRCRASDLRASGALPRPGELPPERVGVIHEWAFRVLAEAGAG
jgi:hypothetical protein